MSRFDRALTQRMYLLDASRPGDMAWEFMIEGSRGVPYRVYMNALRSTCTCPDYVRRRQPCKHIMFISLRVLRLQGSFTTLTRPMDDALKRTLLDKTEAPAPQSAADEKPQEDKPLEGCCPICYEDFEPTDKCERCLTCKNAIHDACITIWLRQKPNCPLCRSPWASVGGARKIAQHDMGGDDVLRKFGHEHFASVPVVTSSSASTDRMTATDAKRKFRLSEEDLAPLPHLTMSNPRFSGGAPMRLYLIADLERIHRQKIANEASAMEELRAAQERSAQTKKDARKQIIEAKEQEKAKKKRSKEEEKRTKALAREAEKVAKKPTKAGTKLRSQIKSATADTAVGLAPTRRSSRASKPSRQALESSEAEKEIATPAVKRSRRA